MVTMTYLLVQVLDGLVSTADIEVDGCSTEGEDAQGERAMGEQHNGYVVVYGKEEEET
jgi:hypothetical protein